MAGFDRSELLRSFLSEAEDHITTLERGFFELENNPDSSDIIEDLFRAAHTLKGAASFVKLTTTRNISHRMEDILEDLRDKKIKASKGIMELLFSMLDAIKDLIQAITEGRGEPPEIEQELFSRIDKVLAKEREVPAFIEPQVEAISERREGVGRRKEDFEFFSGNFVKIDVKKVEEILNLIGEITIKKNYLLQRVRETEEMSEEIFFAGRKLLREVSNFAERYAYSMPSVSGSMKYVDPLLSEFGELEFDRYDDLNLFSRKLQEITDDITEALKELSEFFDSFGDDVSRIGNMIKLLRSDISEARMIEIGRLFQRFVKPVKEMAKQYDKKVELLISGGDTKIDKVIFERLFDPLMHIIRNAITHGIEGPDERLQRAKKEEGLLLLSARREGNYVVIEVNDDGRGIDTDMLFEKAVKRGLIKPEEKPPKEELLSLIFIPGFTTAVSKDMTSGRGIGMSAVRKQVSAINGAVEVDTDVGSSTTFKLKVPSSLAITDVIVFSSGNVEFVIPASLIEEIIEVDLRADGNPEIINYRDKKIYIKNLSEMFGTASMIDKSNRPVIICNVADKKAGLIVDEIIGHEEAIIKPMNRFLEGLYIYSGTTISGDGRVRFVINLMRIFEEEIKPIATIFPGEDYAGRRILIVDDSLSVRRFVSLYLESKKFKVYTASNGVEALNILDETPVDMIITDLEMPVMHGYELISRIKRRNQSKDVPIIVLTSRSAEKHREKALQLGAEDYLVKPFDEKSFEDILRKYFSFPI